jgi:uncharacterized protein (DUF433 family)
VNPLLERISIDPTICAGKPCIRGTRIWVSLILDFLAEDMTEAELLTEYPGLTHEDVLAAIAYGAEAARERVIPVPAQRYGVKFKLDENLSRRAADLIRVAGHDVVTVPDQGLRGTADETLFEVCRREGRALITLDRDFGQVLRYPPTASAGDSRACDRASRFRCSPHRPRKGTHQPAQYRVSKPLC